MFSDKIYKTCKEFNFLLIRTADDFHCFWFRIAWKLQTVHVLSISLYKVPVLHLLLENATVQHFSCFAFVVFMLLTYLICEIIGVKNYFNVACFANKRLRLLRFTTEWTRLSAIRNICFGVAVDNLQKNQYEI